MASDTPRIGWIGTGRMGAALVRRLLEAGQDVAVWNRTREKAEPLADLGATLVGRPVDLADRDIVFTTVSSSDVFERVTTGEGGVLSDPGRCPRVVVDSSTVSVESSARVRGAASTLGAALLAAPVSGNPEVVDSGQLTVVVSGDEAAFATARPVLELFGRSVMYVGGDDRARLVKICHNLLLGVVTQSLAEVTVLAQRAGIARADFLQFINASVLGSAFTRYKTPAFVNLDFTPTFTGHLLRKDFELGLDAGREHDVPLPLAALTHQIVTHLIGSGRGDVDFAALLELEADGAGIALRPENREESDVLEPDGIP